MRRLFFHPAAAVLVIMSSLPALADLEEVKKETNLPRRSRLALENADTALDRAREAYRKGDGEGLDQSLAEVTASVELAYESLVEQGRNPRRNAQPYKRGEISTRELLRRLETFRDEMSYTDRDRIAPTIEAVEKAHSDFLRDVMGGRQ